MASARWVSEYVLGTTQSRHNWNGARRRKRGFTMIAYTHPQQPRAVMYAPYVPFIPLGGVIRYVIRVRPKPGPKLDTSSWSLRNDKGPHVR